MFGAIFVRVMERKLDDGLGRGRQRLLGGRCRYRGSPLLIVVDAD